MNRNVFIRMQAISSASKSKDNGSKAEVPSISRKNNPDVMQEYERIKNRNNEPIVYSKVTWKGITGDTMDFDPTVSENFICAKDKRDFNGILTETEREIAQREKERLEEIKQLELIKAQNIDTILEMEQEICGNDVDESQVIFDELKITSNSETCNNIKEAQDSFNMLLNSISKI